MLERLDNEEIEEVLRNNSLGRIGCSDRKKIYVVPVNYVYDGQYILAHSQKGLKIDMMRNNPDVCFEVDEVKDFNNWRSVILWGVYQELSNERSRYDVMKVFAEKMMHIKVSAPMDSRAISKGDNNHVQYLSNKPVIYRIVINERTGRFERV